jgi:beta-1,4-N-acetylglucosaminyltransferase
MNGETLFLWSIDATSITTNKMKHVFVTVGTTEFDELIEAVTSSKVLNLLHEFGEFNEMIVQMGKGKFRPTIRENDPIKVTVYDYKPSLHEDMAAADLIISHCGAGSLMEALGLRKTTVAVVNKSLWDNHQLELAEAFAQDNHIVYTTPEELAQLIADPGFFTNTLAYVIC